MVLIIVIWTVIGIWWLVRSLLTLTTHASVNVVNAFLVQSDISYGIEQQDDQPGSSGGVSDQPGDNNTEIEQPSGDTDVNDQQGTRSRTLLEISNTIDNRIEDPLHEHVD